MSLIIDIILIVIVVGSAFLAARKGFIGTIFSLGAIVASIILSILLSGPVSLFVDDNFVNPAVKKYILSIVDESTAGQTYEQALSSVDVVSKVEQMPQELKDVLEFAGVDTSEIVEKAKETQKDVEKAKDDLIDSIASPISSVVSRVIALFGLFIILSIGLWFASKLLTSVLKLIPLGKTFNTFGGMALGILQGIAIVFVISLLFSAASKMIAPDSDNVFSKKTIDSTVVLKTAIDFNPMGFVSNIK